MKITPNQRDRLLAELVRLGFVRPDAVPPVAPAPGARRRRPAEDYDAKLDRIERELKTLRAAWASHWLVRYRNGKVVAPTKADAAKERRLLREYRRLIEL